MLTPEFEEDVIEFIHSVRRCSVTDLLAVKREALRLLKQAGVPIEKETTNA